jgi:hypothetical protein
MGGKSKNREAGEPGAGFGKTIIKQAFFVRFINS